jgi:importin subunit beta-1
LPTQTPLVYINAINTACSTLVPLMLEKMTKQEEENDDDDDEESWNISKAAATLLESIARVVRDTVVDLVVPFIQSNINMTDWRLKEAAITAFCVILEGEKD